MNLPKNSTKTYANNSLGATGVNISNMRNDTSNIDADDDEDQQQRKSRISGGVYQKLLTDPDYPSFNRKQKTFGSCNLECFTALFRNAFRRYGLILVFVIAFIVIFAVHSSFKLAQWTSSTDQSQFVPSNNVFPRLSRLPLDTVETNAVINYEKMVRGLRTCEAVLDSNTGQPTGNFTFAQHPATDAVPPRTQPRRHPFIVHYVRIIPDYQIDDPGGHFNFSYESLVLQMKWELTRMQYLSIMSAWKALVEAKKFELESNAETAIMADDSEPIIYVHSNYEPRGKYYDLLTSERSSVNFRWNFVANFAKLNGDDVFRIEHRADFQKVNATFTFGGVHSDFDVIWINGTHMRELQNSGECFFSVDVNIRTQEPWALRLRKNLGFILNAGIFGCQKQSKFLKLWRDSYYCDYTPDYLYNSGFLPRVLYEYYNELASPIALDRHSGMYWRPELIEEVERLDGKQVSSDQWLKFPALHFYHMEYFDFKWDRLLRNSTSILAQVLRKAQFNTIEPQTSPLVDWD